MSFILDALKKLEEKRQSESVPNLTTIHIESSIKKKRPHMTYLLIGVLLLNAVLIAAWLRPQQRENSSFTSQAVKENIDITVPTTPMNDEANTKKNTLPLQEVVKADPTPDIVVTETLKVPEVESASLPLNPSPAEIKELTNRIAEEQLLVINSPAPELAIEEKNLTTEQEISSPDERTVLNISQLPLSIKEGLPDLTITAHIYSNNPASRLINIKGSLIREGGTVTSGLKVNEITESGVVFDYGGLLFSVNAF